MPEIVFALWCAQFLLEAVAAVRLWRTGLVHRFPILTTWFAVSASCTLILLETRYFNPAAYPSRYSIICMLLLLLESGCVVEAFFALCGKFRDFARIGGALLTILWLIGGASSAAVRLSWIPENWTQIWHMVVIGARYADLAMVVVLAAAWAILQIPAVPIARSANLVTGIILSHSLYGFVLSSVTIARSDRPYWWIVGATLIGGGLTAAAAAFLKPVPEEYAMPPVPTPEEVLRAKRDMDFACDRFEESAEQLTRELFGE